VKVRASIKLRRGLRSFARVFFLHLTQYKFLHDTELCLLGRLRIFPGFCLSSGRKKNLFSHFIGHRRLAEKKLFFFAPGSLRLHKSLSFAFIVKCHVKDQCYLLFADWCLWESEKVLLLKGNPTFWSIVVFVYCHYITIGSHIHDTDWVSEWALDKERINFWTNNFTLVL